MGVDKLCTTTSAGGMMRELFEDLFVLELANNHQGDIVRGKKIINEFSKVTSEQGLKTAIKLQFRDGENFVHKDFRTDFENSYINKVLKTKMSQNKYKILTDEIKKHGHITIATPFDEKSVETCAELNIDIIKIASANIDDWFLIQKTTEIKKPVIISTGGSTPEKIDAVVTFFAEKNIPLAINHCVSIYPSQSQNMQLNQIDFLKNRYTNVIGFSTHEYNNTLEDSMLIAYAKGARLFERHIDLEDTNLKYCSTPQDIAKWMSAYKRAKILCGSTYREISQQETDSLKIFERGVYAQKNIEKGQILTKNDVYFAIPKQDGQMSSKEFKEGTKSLQKITKDHPF